jgi:exodeoxyribonuclease V alpha subunit
MMRPDLAQLRATAGDVPYGDYRLVCTLCDYYKLSETSDVVLLSHLVLALLDAMREGHVCLDLGKVAGGRLWLGTVEAPSEHVAYEFPDQDELQRWLDSLPNQDSFTPLVRVDNRLYTRRMWGLERALAERLIVFDKEDALSPSRLEKARASIKCLFPEARTGADEAIDWQQVACALALTRRFLVLTGGPGTGKTTTVTRMIAALAQLGCIEPEQGSVALVAPTGKAAQRLKESVLAEKQRLKQAGLVPEEVLASIPEETSTVHRLLGKLPDRPGFRHGPERPLAARLLVVDEASMMDLPLMTSLFRAIADDARVILIGDPNQLPSVGAGGVLAELVEAEHRGYSRVSAQAIAAITGFRVPVAEDCTTPWHTALVAGHRFSQGSPLGRLATAVQKGQFERATEVLKQHDDDTLAWHAEWDEELLLTLAEKGWEPLVKATTLDDAFDALRSFRLLSPLRQGRWGAEALNERIEARLQGPASAGKRKAYKGRPIMVTENHYGLRLFNGDIGVVWQSPEKGLHAVFEDDTGYREIPLNRLPRVEPVYAMTIHKTQGSEFDEVLMILPEDAQRLLARELVFTGLTRAKRRLTLMAEPAVWSRSLQQVVVRDGGLRATMRTLRSCGSGDDAG